MDRKHLGYQMHISAALTLLGSLAVVVTYWRHEELHRLLYVKVIVYAILCSGISAIAFEMGKWPQYLLLCVCECVSHV